MDLFMTKMKEVSKTLFPVVILVLLLSTTLVDIPGDITLRFLIGSFLLLIGLTVFLIGIDIAMNPIGDYMSQEVASSNTVIKVGLLSFLLGFLITVAEPDLLILGNQIEGASGGDLSSFLIVYTVSFGVGVMVSLGVFRLLKGMKMNLFMALVYGVILVLGFLVSEEFLAISFDASGATTGALTTPFVLSLSYGLSNFKMGESSREDSFGLVGIMSSGPILAIMLISIISGQKNIQGVAEDYVFLTGIFKPIFDTLPIVIRESIFALLPISILFFIYNHFKFKIKKAEIQKILFGLLLTALGLIIFLTAVNSGFMDMGRVLGMNIATLDKKVLILTGFLIGLIIVLVEPAVHVLGEQIQEVSGGSIPINVIRMTLSLGVGIAIAISMARIAFPSVKLWYFLLPGFLIGVILSFFTDPIFVGIAFDAGGVASGPMTATFVLAFAQGAASSIETANVLVDGFGVIAMVAMAPVFSLMILGMAFKSRKVVKHVKDLELAIDDTPKYIPVAQHYYVMATVELGYSKLVLETITRFDVKDTNVYHASGTYEDQHIELPIVNLRLLDEKEVVFFRIEAERAKEILDTLYYREELRGDANLRLHVTAEF